MNHSFQFRERILEDNAWITQIATQMWGSVEIISKDHTYNLLDLRTLVGVLEDKTIGFITYVIEKNQCEIVAIYCEVTKKGLGTAFINQVKNLAVNAGCTRVWLMTTNDNTEALRFYQKRGFTITAIRINEIDKQRKLKPSIPLLGNDAIPIQDEIELNLSL